LRILMPCYEYPPLGGGAASVVHGLSLALARQGHQVDVLTMGFGDLPRLERQGDVTVHRVSCGRKKQSVCTAHEAAVYLCVAHSVASRLAERNRYDFNHTHFILPDGIIAWRLRASTGLPYLITAHGSDVPGYNPHHLKLLHQFTTPLWNVVVRHAQDIVCPSEMLQSLILKQAIATPVTVIPNGIDAVRFDTNERRQRRILVVSRMLERKGVQHVFEALGDLRLNYELHIVGDGPYLPVLQQLPKPQYMRVVFHGWLERDSPELKALYETSRMFVFPSEVENCPVVLLEAMSAGLAIITTRGTGCAELVGDAGLLVEPKNPEAIRRAIVALAGDEERMRQVGQAARRRVEDRFSWASIANEYIRLYGKRAPSRVPELLKDRGEMA
jgi:glycosyltransferase involved in cell wall biosynthesis